MYDYTVEDLDFNKIKVELDNIDITSINYNLDEIYNKTSSINYANIVPSGLVTECNLESIDAIKSEITNLINKLNTFKSEINTLISTEFNTTRNVTNNTAESINERMGNGTLLNGILTNVMVQGVDDDAIKKELTQISNLLDNLLNNNKISQDNYQLTVSLLNKLLSTLNNGKLNQESYMLSLSLLNRLFTNLNSDKLSQESYALTIAILDKALNLLNSGKIDQETYALLVSAIDKLLELLSESKLNNDKYNLTIKALFSLINLLDNGKIDQEIYKLTLLTISDLVNGLYENKINQETYALMIESIKNLIESLQSDSITQDQYKLLINSIKDIVTSILKDTTTMDKYRIVINSLNSDSVLANNGLINNDMASSMSRYYVDLSGEISNNTITEANVNNSTMTHIMLNDLLTNGTIKQKDYETVNNLLDQNIDNSNETPFVMTSDKNKSIIPLNINIVWGGVAVVGLLIVGLLYKKHKKEKYNDKFNDNNYDAYYDSALTNSIEENNIEPGVYPVSNYEIESGEITDYNII